jgi:uncharacterized membrane protein
MSSETKTAPADGQPGVESISSRAAIAGHPLHPMLIHFPVAALVGLVGCDFAWLITRDPFWGRAGLWLAGIGAGGGWLASGLGLIDLLLPRVREKITAWCHALLAVMMLSLASLNWLLRYRQGAASLGGWELSLSLLTAGLIVGAAYLGGRLVYEHAVGVEVGHEAAIEDSSAL